MNMYQKRKERQTKKTENNEKSLSQVVINCDVGINGNHYKSTEI